MSATGLPDRDLRARYQTLPPGNFSECQCQGGAGCPHHDKPPFGPDDWVIWDGKSEPSQVLWTYGDGGWYFADRADNWNLASTRHMRLATVADFDAAIAKYEAKIKKLKAARGPSVKAREILASLGRMKRRVPGRHGD